MSTSETELSHEPRRAGARGQAPDHGKLEWIVVMKPVSDFKAASAPGHWKRFVDRSGLLTVLTSLLGAGCSRCDHSSPAQRVSNGATAPSIPPQLLAAAGRLGPIIAHNSPECLACAEAGCKERIDKCLNIEGTAAAGPAQGRARAELCAESLDCAIKSRCVTGGSAMSCYCGTAFGLDCISPKANGSCKAKLEAGLETTDPKEIAVNYGDDKRGGGAAMQLVQCLINHRCDRCF